MAFTDKIDTSLPAGSDDPAEADDNMRRIQGGFQEILAVEHNVDLTGTEITGDGKHTAINATSVTSSGAISGTTITASGAVTAQAAMTVATTLGVTGIATLGDGSLLATTANPTTDAMIANKEYVDNYIKLVDSKASGVQGGTFTSGDWRKRTVAEETDIGGHVSVSSSVIVLDAGTYQVKISCPARTVGTHQSRLRNTTAGTTLLVGTSELAPTDDATITRSFIVGTITVAASQNLEIQHRCTTTKTNDGFGEQNSFGEVEIYTISEFWKR